MTTVIDIPLEEIVPSPSNPRKTFRKLDELAESIAASGVLQPVTVRHRGQDENGVGGVLGYELVIGERRWRASKIARRDTVPAIVREMTDTEVLEAQVVENGQRSDVHPLEEAEGYQALLEHHGYTIDGLAAKTGRSLSHLYGRLKLTRLAPAVRAAFLDDKIGAAIAELLARIPVLKLQEQALADVLGSSNELETIGIQPEISADVRQPLSFRSAQALIHRRYSTRLDMAKFEVTDPGLVPAAGACTTCVHRSGYRNDSQPALFPDLEKAADVCTNPPCFERKTAAVWARESAAAAERGIEVIEGDDAKDVFGYDGRTAARARYVDPASDIPYEILRNPGKPTTWAKALGRDAGKVPIVMVQDPSGAPRALFDKSTAMSVLTEAGKIDKPLKPAPKAKKPPASKSDADRRALRDRAINKMATEAIAAAGKIDGKRELAWLRWLAAWALELTESSLTESSAVTIGLDPRKPLKVQLAERATTTAKLRQLLTGLAFADLVTNSDNDPKDGGLIATACNVLGIDAFAVVSAAIRAADKEADKIELAKNAAGKGRGR